MYAPYGEQRLSQHLGTYDERFRFTGKERDAETGYDYFGARYRGPKFLDYFLSVDPLADKYIYNSPYVYCDGNPIKYIDPNGMDDYEVNELDGTLKVLTNKQRDAFFIVDKDGNRKDINPIVFDYGTVEKYKSTRDGSSRYDWFEVRGDQNASELFEYLATNTAVEWSQLMMGIAGPKGFNLISTSHSTRTECSISFLLEQKFHNGYYIREYTHNHPNNTRYPSGIGLNTNPTTLVGDIGMAIYLKQNALRNGFPTPLLYIYVPSDGSRLFYNENSTLKQFGF